MNHFFAEALINANEIGVNKTSSTNITPVLNAVYFWAGVLAVLLIIVAAFRFVTSNGDAAQVAQARKGILGAIIGIVLIFSAFIITNFVIGRL